MGFLKKFGEIYKKYFRNPHWMCIACGKDIFEEKYFCEECEKNLPFISPPYCSHCGRKTKLPETYCTSCKNFFADIEKSRSVFEYKDPIKQIIVLQKEKQNSYSFDAFAGYLVNVYLQNYFNADALCYVPSSKKTMAKRGFNQGKVLADKVAEKLNLTVLDCIIKIKDTHKQVGLNRAERLKNLKNSFKVTDKNAVKDKTIVIIDDVLTTGATALAVADVLKRAGAKVVYLLTVASTTSPAEKIKNQP